MPMPISTKAEKYLSKSDRFERLQGTLPPQYAKVFNPDEGEECIGLFYNSPGQLHELILITDKGIYIAENELNCKFIGYSDIVSIDWLGKTKREMADHEEKRVLVVELKNGRVEHCPARIDFAQLHTFLNGAMLIKRILDSKC